MIPKTINYGIMFFKLFIKIIKCYYWTCYEQNMWYNANINLIPIFHLTNCCWKLLIRIAILFQHFSLEVRVDITRGTCCCHNSLKSQQMFIVYIRNDVLFTMKLGIFIGQLYPFLNRWVVLYCLIRFFSISLKD